MAGGRGGEESFSSWGMRRRNDRRLGVPDRRGASCEGVSPPPDGMLSGVRRNAVATVAAAASHSQIKSKYQRKIFSRHSGHKENVYPRKESTKSDIFVIREATQTCTSHDPNGSNKCRHTICVVARRQAHTKRVSRLLVRSGGGRPLPLPKKHCCREMGA